MNLRFSTIVLNIGPTKKKSMESSSSESSCSVGLENEYDVEYILGKRIRYGGVSILIGCGRSIHNSIIIFDGQQE